MLGASLGPGFTQGLHGSAGMKDTPQTLSPLPSLSHARFLSLAGVALLASCLSYWAVDIPVARFFFGLTDARIEDVAFWMSKVGTIVRPELALLAFLVFRRRRPHWATAGLFFFAAVLGAGLLNVGLKVLAGRCRPELFFRENLYGFTFLRTDAGYWSFPSGHTASAMAAMTVLSLLFPRWTPLFLLHAALVGLSRVALMEHYVSDVIAGGVVGLTVALAAYDLYFRQALTRSGWRSAGSRVSL